MRPRYSSLEDFLAGNTLTVDAGGIDDGWGGLMAVKGREIRATVLFADITAFSRRTLDLDPTETLAFVNHFFTWIGAEALRHGSGIVDKYIGDEVMVIFSKEFGSEDPFAEAIRTARAMCDHDVHAFAPHIGIASGVVIVGYVGTSMKYDCSVFGAPVALAARCAGQAPHYEGTYQCSVAFPAADWGERTVDDLIPPKQATGKDGNPIEERPPWELLDPVSTDLKNLGCVDLRHLVRTGIWMPMQPAEDRARELVAEIAKARRRWQAPLDEEP